MKPDIWKYEVHPAADVFPMLSAEELNELAEDIKTNGLVHPLVVKDGILIDGRNRREACKIASVTPEVVELNGADPVAYILSSNVNRRHMTKGQRAMAVAMIYPEAAKVKRAGAGSSIPEELRTGYISMARTVLKWAQEMAPQVLAGAETLDKAYAIASERKIATEAPIKRLNALRASDPDLADKVVEEALKIEDAEGAARDRRNRERAARQGMYDALQAMERYLFVFQEPSQRAEFVRIVNEHPNEINRDDVLKCLSGWSSAIGETLGELTNA